MARFDVRILNKLLDSYERSSLAKGTNKVAVHIDFRFSKKSVPEYFDESSLAFEEIHACAHELEDKGFVRIVWKKGKEDHIIEKLVLNEKKVKEIYQYLGRTSHEDYVRNTLKLVGILREQCTAPVAGKLLDWLDERLRGDLPVKEFIDLTCPEETKKLIRAVQAVEENEEENYIREFSIRNFSDSKTFEQMCGKIGRIFRRFSPEFAEADTEEILAEYGIYHMPNYIYLKGLGTLALGKAEKEFLDLSLLRQGIGLSGDDLSDIRITGREKIRKIITIENLTTFFRWQEENALIIYLGGYHNKVRRRLLKEIYETLPDAEYLHFGDIDVGGFEIYRDLCRKTDIPFRLYHMGIEELETYRNYGKKLTENDRKRLKLLLEQAEKEKAEYVQTLKYMEDQGIKLEQECISNYGTENCYVEAVV